MKTNRHEKILEIISKYPVTTQEELINYLKNDGYDVTQSTVSRDIKQLRLTKTLMADGKYRYQQANVAKTASIDNLSGFFKSSVVSAKNANNLVVVKTYSGMAQAACAALDRMELDEVIGTLAGEDTFFAVCSDEKSAKRVVEEISKHIR